jgi:oxygen-dependent protoporphyrinogen oxidase
MNQRIAIVGAGISGLAAALRLRVIEPGLEITVFERDERAGGKIQTEHVDGFVIEAGPDAFLSSKRGGVGLSHALGLDELMVSPVAENRRSFVLSRGRLIPLPQGLSGLVPGELRPMFQSRLLSPLGKLRMTLDFVIPPRHAPEDESLASFITRRFGTEMYERMIEPLLSGIYAGDGARLSLAATFPQLRASEVTHGGILKGAIAQKNEAAIRQEGQVPKRGFLSFGEGMSVLVDAAVEAAERSGTRFRYRAECTGLRKNPAGQGYQLTVDDNGRKSDHTFDGVIVATPTRAAVTLLADVAPPASEALARIEHVTTALIAIAFPEAQLTRPLNGYGYVVPRAENREVMAMTWVSSKWSHRAPEGQVLIRAFVGRAGQTSALSGDDQSLIDLTLEELREVLGLSVTPTLTRVFRWERGMPQYNMGHLELVDDVESCIARTSGIDIAGNMLRGVGIPDCIVSGETAANNIMIDLRNPPAVSEPQ